ncbi:AraC family transcriptional regulator [Streptomyces armeniacus]|uniref:AraC family transcriptional regulator n=1 Tax=Streptomyces armeniacus TaxID=83291 RepID=A0A345XZH7_9ACTN|nr:AraC family transcriptional regulator [Streptomyces armeniacus]
MRHDVVWDPGSLPDGDGDGGGNFDRNGDDGPRGGAGPPSPGRRRALVLRIRAFIQQRLHDPELSPAAVASAHHISVSHLHRLFQEQGTTVAAWIRQQRLEAASQDLADPRLFEQPVRHIATRWGFTHPAAFSRTFRNHYGVPPTDYRWRAERGAL